MKWHHEMMRAIDSPLEQAPEIFNAVGMNTSAHKLFSVIDYFVRVVIFESVTERASGISKQIRAALNVSADQRVEYFTALIADSFCANFTVT